MRRKSIYSKAPCGAVDLWWRERIRPPKKRRFDSWRLEIESWWISLPPRISLRFGRRGSSWCVPARLPTSKTPLASPWSKTPKRPLGGEKNLHRYRRGLKLKVRVVNFWVEYDDLFAAQVIYHHPRIPPPEKQHFFVKYRYHMRSKHGI